MYRRPGGSQRYGQRPSRTPHSRPGPLGWLPRTPPGNTRAARSTSSGTSLMSASFRVPPSYAGRHQNTGSGEMTGLEQGQSVVGVLQRKRSDRRPNRNPRGFAQQLGAVGPRVGGYAADPTLVVKISVSELWTRAPGKAGRRPVTAGPAV